MPEAGIVAAGISKAYGGVQALEGVDFTAAFGEVHALLGENGAGKSTMIKVLSGAVRPDAGKLSVAGVELDLHDRSDAQHAGIASVFQELSLVPDLDVAQNVFFGHQPRTRLRTVSARRLRSETRAVLQRLGVEGIDPGASIRSLSLAQRQLVEIVRAIVLDPKVLILDEPTSALSAGEVDWLVALCRDLAARGTAVIFISHRMAEVRRIADRVTIFRNGRLVGAHAMADIDDDQIVDEMLGRKPGRLYPPRAGNVSGEVALRIEQLSDARHLRGIDLEVHKGEILGVGGLQGQGQSELLLALYGAIPSRGTITVDGEVRRIGSPRDAIDAGLGLALVPEDRQQQGLLLPKSIKDNVTLSVLKRVTGGLGLIDREAEARLVAAGLSGLNLVAENLDQPAGSLSGGNQQKVVIAKVLLTEARILLLHDLVRGVDVGTKAEIFQLMRTLADEGYAIVFYTTDLQELVNVSDRVAVIREGAVAEMLEGDRMTEANVLHAAIGAAGPGTGAAPAVARARGAALMPRVTRAMPFLLLLALVLLYASRQDGVLTSSQLSLTTAGTMTLILVAAGQTIVVLSGGFDLSVGGVVSLTTVVAATRFPEHGAGVLGWILLVCAGGLALGALNGLIVTRLRMDPFIVTLATWSIWSGLSSLLLAIDGGTIPTAITSFGNGSLVGLGTAVWLAVVLLIGWAWFTRTRTGIEISSVGSSPTAAYLSGVNVRRRLVTAYALSGLFAVLAGLFLTTQTATGSPSGGDEFILTSVAAVVIGGTALSGGRATMAGTIAAALILTLIGNVVFSYGLASGWHVALGGVLLIVAVLINTIPAAVARRRGGLATS
ncbi:MAG TPA: ATP-binding cassette domain-containing protein [Baekduia sp.]|nr:ATP-binding cassette domain-containing protein [Baekduia sp.]